MEALIGWFTGETDEGAEADTADELANGSDGLEGIGISELAPASAQGAVEAGGGTPSAAKRAATPEVTGNNNAYEALGVVLADSNDIDDHAATPRLLVKFDALTNLWSSPSPRPFKMRQTETTTPRLLNKLGELERQWSTDSESPMKTIQIGRTQPQQQPREDSSTWSVQSKDSSLGRTTLSSHETCLATGAKDAQQTVFERLYRNERRYKSHVRRRGSPPPLVDEERQQLFQLGSPTNSLGSYSTAAASLEKRLSFLPPGEVRRVRQQQRRDTSSVTTPTSAKTDSVFERLYRKEPRAKSLIVPKPRQQLPSASRSITSSAAPSVQSAHEPRTGASSLTPKKDSVYERLYKQALRPTPVSTHSPKHRSGGARSATAATPSRMGANVRATIHERSIMASPSSAASVTSRNTAATDTVFERLSRKAPCPKIAVTPAARKAAVPTRTSPSSASVSSAATDSVFERLYRRELRPATSAKTTNTERSIQKQRRAVTTPPSASVSSAVADSVFDRLHRNEPRPSGIPTVRTATSHLPACSALSVQRRRDPSTPSSASAASVGTESVFDRFHRKEPRASRRPTPGSSRSVQSRPDQGTLLRHRTGTLSSIDTGKMRHRIRSEDLNVETGFETEKKSKAGGDPSPATATETASTTSSTNTPTSATTNTTVSNFNNATHQQGLAFIGPSLRQQEPPTPKRGSQRDYESPPKKAAALKPEDAFSQRDDDFVRRNELLELLDCPDDLAIPTDGDVESRSASLIQYYWLDYCARTVREDFISDGVDQVEATVAVRPHHYTTQGEVDGAATLIQCIWRMIYAKRMRGKVKFAVSRLQATWRMRVHRSRFQRELSTMKLFAALERAEATDQARMLWKQANAREESVFRRDHCAKVIQAKWRSWVATRGQLQRALEQQEQEQNASGSWSARQEILALESAASTVQQRWSNFMIKRRTDVAAITIQSAYRSYFRRRSFQKARVAVSKIQTAFRDWLLLQQQKSFDLAASRIQSRWRAFSNRWQLAAETARDEVLRQDALQATKIQSVWRSHVAKSAYRRHVMATKLQCLWRRFFVHLAFARMKLDGAHQKEVAAEMIQARWRKHLARGLLRRHVDASASMIQAKWREISARVSSEKRRRTTAAVRAEFRGSLQLQVKNRSAGTIQICWKRFRVAQSREAALQRLRLREASATVIQAKWRMLLARDLLRRHLFAWKLVQSKWRGTMARATLQKRRCAASTLQATFRGRRVRYERQVRNLSAVTIQVRWQTYRILASLREAAVHRLRRREASATAIQSIWRTCLAQDLRRRHLAAANNIQSKWRGIASRVAFHQLRHVVRSLQATFRGRRSRLDLEAKKKFASAFQSLWKRHRALVQFREADLRRRDACAIAIQAIWRAFLAQDLLRRHIIASTTIQSTWRSIASRVAFHQHRRAASALQAQSRGSTARLQLQVKNMSADTIQICWKRYWVLAQSREAALQRLRLKEASATAIQSIWRTRLAQDQLHRRVMASTSIQSRWRGVATRVAFDERGTWIRLQLHANSRAAFTIQNIWKRRLRQAEQRRRDACVIAIQAIWRSFLAQDLLRRHVIASTRIQSKWRVQRALNDYSEIRGALLALQAAFRGSVVRQHLQQEHAAASRIQLWWVALVNKEATLRRMDRSALCIQAKWRSCRARDQLRMRLAAENIKSAARVLCMRLADNQARIAASLLQAVFRGSRTQRLRIFRKAALTIPRGSQERLLLQTGNVESAAALSQQIESEIALLADDHCSQERNDAAAKIQTTYITRKMVRALSKLESATFLLHRGLRGTFSRSTAVYALLQINSVLRSSWVVSFCHLVDAYSASHPATMKKWERLMSTARHLAAILVQSFMRGSLCRMKLTRRQRVAKQMFGMIPLSKRSASVTLSDSCLPLRSFTNADDTSELDQVYRERVQIRSSEIIARRAETLAESVVACLLCGNSSFGWEYEGLLEAPCLLRLAARTKKAQTGDVCSLLTRNVTSVDPSKLESTNALGHDDVKAAHDVEHDDSSSIPPGEQEASLLRIEEPASNEETQLETADVREKKPVRSFWGLW